MLITNKTGFNLNFNKMKKLGKLSISPEKVIKNEELINLRGGYDSGGYENSGSCGFMHPDGDVFCNLTYAEAKNSWDAFGPGQGARWCCDSCSEAEWYTNNCPSV